MIRSEITAALQAVLFACGSPVEFDRLCDVLGISADELHEAAELLKGDLDEPQSGISLIKVENAYQLCTKPIYSEPVKKALQLRKVPPLSKASLEVLAIVAYNQPVTRSFVEQVRGVDSSYIVASLMDKGLLCERGTLDAPGRPTLFGTTDNFLRCFGLETLADLPLIDLAAAAGAPDDGQTTIDAVVSKAEEEQ